jgi:ABC-type glycerol-3-phosphate transport system permease component
MEPVHVAALGYQLTRVSYRTDRHLDAFDIDAVSLGLMMAGVVIVIVPSLSIFVFMNKQLINGLMAGAVKG